MAELIDPGPIPGVDLYAVHHSGSQGGIDRIVIHATCPGSGGFPDSSEPDSAWGTARYFTNQSSGGSAHTVTDTDNLVSCLPENVEAWHAPPNSRSIGNEVGGQNWYSREQWLNPKVRMAWERTAKRSAEQSIRWGVPRVKLSVADLLAGKRGFAGHVDVSQAWHQSDHSDPGPNFPWDIFIERVDYYAYHDVDPFIPDTDTDTEQDVLDMAITETRLREIIRQEVIGVLRAKEFSETETRKLIAADTKLDQDALDKVKEATLYGLAANKKLDAAAAPPPTPAK